MTNTPEPTAGAPTLVRGKKQVKQAVTDFTMAIELKPEFQMAWKGRSQAYKDLGRREESRADRAMVKQLSSPVKKIRCGSGAWSIQCDIRKSVSRQTAGCPAGCKSNRSAGGSQLPQAWHQSKLQNDRRTIRQTYLPWISPGRFLRTGKRKDSCNPKMIPNEFS